MPTSDIVHIATCKMSLFYFLKIPLKFRCDYYPSKTSKIKNTSKTVYEIKKQCAGATKKIGYFNNLKKEVTGYILD